MTCKTIIAAIGWLVATTAVSLPQWANAQDGGQPVRIVVPFPPGNSIDAAARALADALRKTSKRNYIIDNKPGASSIIGSTEVARAKPDGTVLLFMTGGHTTNAALYKKLPFDPIKDFTPITQVADWPGFLLLVSSASPYKTFQEFSAAAKANPGKLTYGSFGVGNTSHLAGALLAQSAGLNLVHVPYKTSPIPDLIAGHIDALFVGSAFARPLIDDGKIRALAVSGEKRLSTMPNVPLYAEFGIKEVDVAAWSGLMGPAGMSAATAQQIQREVAEAVRQPAYVAMMRTLEMNTVVSSPMEFADYVSTEIARLKKQLAPLGIELD